MIFPITELLDERERMAWVEKHFHPQGLRCPGCGVTVDRARAFRTRKRGLVDYRCRDCQHVYNLYTGTLFAGSNLSPQRVVLLVRGVTLCAPLAHATASPGACDLDSDHAARR
jgi:hypothetical protein